MTFGENLIRLRRQQGLSQEQLGMRIGVSRQTVSKWELNDTTPEMEKLIALADLFGLSLDELTGRVSPEVQTASVAADSPFRAVYLPAQHFEYRSKRTLFGLPLVHICLGNGKLCTAKGILAIGNIALGVFALGGLSAGLFSIGGISLGLLFSLGGLSMGGLTLGGVSVGLFALGGFAHGRLCDRRLRCGGAHRSRRLCRRTHCHRRPDIGGHSDRRPRRRIPPLC